MAIDDYWFNERQFLQFKQQELYPAGIFAGAIGGFLAPGVVAEITLISIDQIEWLAPAYKTGAVWLDETDFGPEGFIPGNSGLEDWDGGTTVTVGGCERDDIETVSLRFPAISHAESTARGLWDAVYSREYTDEGHGCGTEALEVVSRFGIKYNALNYSYAAALHATAKRLPGSNTTFSFVQDSFFFEQDLTTCALIRCVDIPDYLTKNPGFPINYRLGWLTFGYKNDL